MRHSNREQIEKISSQPVTAPAVVKSKGSFWGKIKAGCCLVLVAGLVAGGLYIYKFYQEAKAKMDSEINKNKELYQDTKETIEKANENYQEINAAIEEGKAYLDKAEELKDKISN
ncbi:MAG: hypothetical protein ACOZBH_05530 [Patescibacteria group bacterium]